MKTFALLILVASALAAPANVDCGKAPAAAAAGGAAGAAAGAGGAAAAASCTKTRSDLAAGIQANLDIQAKELAGYVIPLI